MSDVSDAEATAARRRGAALYAFCVNGPHVRASLIGDEVRECGIPSTMEDILAALDWLADRGFVLYRDRTADPLVILQYAGLKVAGRDPGVPGITSYQVED